MLGYFILFISFLLLTGCLETKTKTDKNPSESIYIEKEIDQLLSEDKKNKLLELEYLEQIRIAQENNDTEAFEFFFQEYVKVERLDIPEELKNRPNYFKGGLKVKY